MLHVRISSRRRHFPLRRADVAEVMVLASLDARARNCTFELAGGRPGEPLLPPGTLFANIRSEWDTEQFPQMAQ